MSYLVIAASLTLAIKGTKSGSSPPSVVLWIVGLIFLFGYFLLKDKDR